MNTKSLVWGGMIAGSTIGGFVPGLWNGSVFSYLLWSALGAIVGIYFGFRLGKAME